MQQHHVRGAVNIKCAIMTNMIENDCKATIYRAKGSKLVTDGVAIGILYQKIK